MEFQRWFWSVAGGIGFLCCRMELTSQTRYISKHLGAEVGQVVVDEVDRLRHAADESHRHAGNGARLQALAAETTSPHTSSFQRTELLRDIDCVGLSSIFLAGNLGVNEFDDGKGADRQNFNNRSNGGWIR